MFNVSGLLLFSVVTI